MKPAIDVSGISKSYKISHQGEMKADYSTLKDDFAALIKKPFGSSDEEKRETFWALKDINFQVNPGETFGIIGKNGSGKSTMLKILSRIVDPTKGTIKLNGRVASLLEVGTGFHPELTGRENIFFNGSMLGMSRQEIRKKFNDIVDFSEIEKFLDTPVKFYSSGMYVRLAFAVAAHLEPEILILDEVLSVGDAQFQKKSMNKMLSIADGGCTILFVSHSMLAVEELCDRAMLLRKGRVEVIDKTENVTEKYLVGDLSPAERQAYIMTKKEHDANSQEPASEGKHSSGPQSVTEEYLTELTGELETATAVKILDENKKAAGKGARLRGTTKFVPKKLISYEGLNFSNFTINDKPFSDRLRFKSGEPIEVSFQYDSEKSVYIDIGYGIRRKNDNSLAVFTHADLENFVHKTKSSGKITAKLKLPRLAPDNYSLEFHVWVNGELVITEEKICEFAIPETKAFTSQQAFASFPSTVLVDSHWSAHN